MTTKKSFTYFSLILFLFSFMGASCFKDLTTTNIVYQNDFNNNHLNGLEIYGWNNNVFGPVTDNRFRTFGDQALLGKFNNNLIQIPLSGLPGHTELRIEMDLYLHDTWKNDLWSLTLDGNALLITGFSNDNSVQQSYPNWLGNGTPLSPAGKDAINKDLPGTCSLVTSPNGTSLYRIILTIPHTAKSATVGCNDAGGVVNDTCKRSWSVDNIKISILKN